jgi:hypothetical protein
MELNIDIKMKEIIFKLLSFKQITSPTMNTNLSYEGIGWK